MTWRCLLCPATGEGGILQYRRHYRMTHLEVKRAGADADS